MESAGNFFSKNKKVFKTIIILTFSISFGIAMFFVIFTFFKVNHTFIKIKNAYKTGSVLFIGSQITSRVDSIKTEIGDNVKKDQVIITLDSSDIIKNIEQLQDDYSILENNLSESQVLYEECLKILDYQNKRNKYLKNIKEKNIETYSELTKNAEKKLNSTKDSYESGAISESDLTNVEKEYNNLKNTYDTNKIDKELFENVFEKATKEGIIFDGDKILYSKREIENQIKSIKIKMILQKNKIDRAKLDLEKSIIKSPVDGILENILINVGEVIQTGQKVALIALPNDSWVDAIVCEKDIQNIKLGSKATIIFKSMSNKLFKGKVSYISNAIQDDLKSSPYELKVNNNSVGYDTEADKYIKVKIDFDNEGIALQNGISATVLIYKDQRK